jgi:outer membrane protein assembly factor BamB
VASALPWLAAESGPRLAIYPDGAVLVTDPKLCRVSALQTDRLRWMRDFASCGNFITAAVAGDSVAYVRAGNELFAIETNGRERWRASVEGEVPVAIAAPATMPDSRVVIAASPRSVVAHDLDGKPAWRFSAPADESLLAPPLGMHTEGVMLVTSRAAYALGGNGELRWRVAFNGASSAP